MLKHVASVLQYINSPMYGRGGSGLTSKPPIAHLDIKPGNILLKRDLTYVLADFGLAICDDDDLSKYDTLGTPRYAPPERLFRHFQVETIR